jgi:tetratricopeptide (TPR) repeat protein
MAESTASAPAAGYGIAARAGGEPPEGVVHEAALLLAETPEVSAYFESHGDQAGRELRHRCQARIARSVTANGGRIARTAGDASWGYFAEPADALSAAVAIQEQFRKKSIEADPIGVRIGLHFGEVILERQDVIGQIVHQLERLAGRLTPGRIAATRSFRDSRWRNAVPPLPFQPLPNGDGPQALLVVWEASQSADLAGNVQLRLEPIWSLAVSEFGPAWRALTAVRNQLRSNRPVNSEELSDGSLRFLLNDAATAARLGRAAINYLDERLGTASGGLVPVLASVELAGGSGLADLERMPGEIYLSAAIASQAASLETIPESEPGKPPAAFRWPADGTPEEPARFRFAAALGAGPGPPCFYCGARRHPPAHCPTRTAESRPAALDRLGALNPAEINRLFLRHLTGTETPVAGGVSPALAGDAFGELKRVHQLRFFRHLWKTSTDRWESVEDPRFQQRRGGGRGWLALNCIQNGRWAEAEALLNREMKSHPSDARIHGAFGFLAVDQGDFLSADRHFQAALEHARSTPESVFALLQRYRLALLTGRMLDAEKFLERAANQDPACGPAQYESAVFRLRRGEVERGLKELLALVADDRRVYFHVLLDPDLAPWSDYLHAELARRYRSARDEADQWLPRAREAVDKAATRLGTGDRVVRELSAFLSRLSANRASDGYFSLLDAADGAQSILTRTERAVRLRREGLLDLLGHQEGRRRRLAKQLEGAKSGPLTDRLRAEMDELRDEVRSLGKDLEIQGTAPFPAIGEGLDALAERLNGAEFRFRIWGAIRQGLRFLGAFSRFSLILQSINLIIGLFLVPMAIRLLALMVEGWQAPMVYLRLSQMGTLVVGGLIALVVAAFKGLQTMETD